MKQTLRHLDSFRSHGDNNKPKANNSEQPIQENASTSKSNINVSPALDKDHQQEEDRFNFQPNRKQSVLTKVKEKAKKWRQTLVKKKPGYDEDNHTESLGAPMHKPENAPNSMQEEDPSSSRNPSHTQNPRLVRSSTSVHRREELHDPPSHVNAITQAQEKSSSTQNTRDHETGDPTQVKTLAEAVIEKLAPDYATISDASQLTRISSAQRLMCISKPLTVTPSNEDDIDLVDDIGVVYGVYEENGLDKSVSVKEYIKNKLEPGDDERALCQVISKAISASMIPGDKGVMVKVKEVVTSLLQVEEEQEERLKQQQEETQQGVASSTTWRSSSPSPQIPLSTNAYEGEEESHGRILQAN